MAIAHPSLLVLGISLSFTDLPVFGILAPVKDPITNSLSVAKQRVRRILREQQRIAKQRRGIAKQDKALADRNADLELQLIEFQQMVDALSIASKQSLEELPDDVTLGFDEGFAPTYVLTFTNAIRYILERCERRPITAPEIRDRLVKEFNFDFSKYKQQLVPVHNALKRLEEQGEVERTDVLNLFDDWEDSKRGVVRKRPRRTAYVWISPLTRAKTEMQEVQKRRVTPLGKLMIDLDHGPRVGSKARATKIGDKEKK